MLQVIVYNINVKVNKIKVYVGGVRQSPPLITLVDINLAAP